MQIDADGPGPLPIEGRFLIALEPPGNAARDLSLFRASLFSRLGDPSCRFLPELVPLAFSGMPPRRRGSIKGIMRSFDEAWKDLDGDFSSGPVVEAGGFRYLKMEGPLAALADRAKAMLPSLGLESDDGIFVATGLGFPLCQDRGATMGALGEIAFEAAPAISFRDCALVFLRLRLSVEPFAAASWRELARSRRPTGPDRRPSRRGLRGAPGAAPRPS